jgi:predicted dinucleotide-binding enzyme
MRIGILGTGDVGRSLGRGFIASGHEVKMGARSAGHEKAMEWVAEMGEKASEGTFADAAAFGELLVVATLGTANPAVVEAAGPAAFAGKVVIDTTNPLDFSKGFPPDLAIKGDDSGGETLQRLIPEGKVVKAFNTVNNNFMVKPHFVGGPPDMFIAGEDDAAKATVGGILKDFGWEVIDLGGIAASRHLEAMCIVWVLACARTGKWNRAFKLLTAWQG